MLRPFTADDRAAYLQMAHDFYHSDAVDHPVPDAFLEKTADAVLAGTPFASIFLLETNGQTAGYALLAHTWSQEAGGEAVWVEELYVLPQFRGQGLGSAFFRELRGRFPEAARFRLEIEPDNEKARALYARMGYESLNYRQMVLDNS